VITIPVQILCNDEEFERYIADCLTSLRQQIGLGERFRFRVFIGLYPAATPERVAAAADFGASDFEVEVVPLDLNCGYGEKQNHLWERHVAGKVAGASAFLMMNPDMILLNDAVGRLYDAYERHGGEAYIVEARQFPIENPPRAFDPETGEVDWCSGACILTSIRFFESVGGFDEAIHLYCEDVDLSWRAWLAGGKLIYCFDAVVAHMTKGIFVGNYDRFSVTNHVYYTALSHLILIYKYFSYNEELFEDKMGLFWRSEWIDEGTKQAALREFEALKDRLELQRADHPRIRLDDIGIFSDMRPYLF